MHRERLTVIRVDEAEQPVHIRIFLHESLRLLREVRHQFMVTAPARVTGFHHLLPDHETGRYLSKGVAFQSLVNRLIALSARLTQQDGIRDAEFRPESQCDLRFRRALGEKFSHLFESPGLRLIAWRWAPRMPASPRKVGTHRHVCGKRIRLGDNPLLNQISDRWIVTGKRVEGELLVELCDRALLESLLIPLEFRIESRKVLLPQTRQDCELVSSKRRRQPDQWSFRRGSLSLNGQPQSDRQHCAHRGQPSKNVHNSRRPPNQTASILMLISRNRAECVNAPTEIKSAPASAIARTVSSVTPPETSS